AAPPGETTCPLNSAKSSASFSSPNSRAASGIVRPLSHTTPVLGNASLHELRVELLGELRLINPSAILIDDLNTSVSQRPLDGSPPVFSDDHRQRLTREHMEPKATPRRHTFSREDLAPRERETASP